MTLTQLEYILAVADTGSFSQAARQCHVTQPTLSMQIQKLEEELGIVIFDRTKQPIKATSVGEEILHQARLVVRGSQHIREIVDDAKGSLKGELRIGIIPTLAPYLLPLFLKRMKDAYKNLHLTFEELQTETMVEKIRTHSLDLGIVVTPIDDLNIANHVLFYEPFWAYFAKGHALLDKKSVDEKDLSIDEVLLLNEGHCFREQSLSLCRNRKQVLSSDKSFTFESGSLETLKKLVDQGENFTLLPWLAAMDVQDKKRLRPFSEPIPTREVSLIHGPHFQRKALLKALIENIKKNLPEGLSLTRAKNQLKVDNPLGTLK
ncbi:hydrogen peroxide-inducible genes activator [Bdellovibrio sp. 22V]|uniref:hydrogen peroxide-inducible genes activator n=1 Tax=Bdellovibrio TaxID=958 RepID=UPI002542A422|nr:hydrogen peroxide-inducible genes activator [Bdellovibrio sp. 22V]WII73645.1 hydrogen peroxide-inducible genes activator [Bdellovibrio sp. 22V]